MKDNAAKLHVGRNKIAIVDLDMLPLLSPYKWNYNGIRNGKGYASTKIDGTDVRMHQLIMGVIKGKEIDHINGNSLDNRRENLRHCTHGVNLQNKAGWGYSKYKGVSRYKNKFQAHIMKEGKSYHLGTFNNDVDAAKAYDKKARELYGKDAYINYPIEEFACAI
ncbi:MAG: hypothetical protein GY845_17490 [Planctomycetes bacterium]|nr:hypothetical protein [Planctomycetota bacterium]